MTFVRPPLEKYVRITVTAGGYTFEPAVEWRDGDTFSRVALQLEAIAGGAARGVLAVGSVIKPNPMLVAESIGKTIALAWPDRAYFVEVWEEGSAGFAQIFQPYGVPRNQQTAAQAAVVESASESEDSQRYELRVPAEDKARWQRTAGLAGISLSEFIHAYPVDTQRTHS